MDKIEFFYVRQGLTESINIAHNKTSYGRRRIIIPFEYFPRIKLASRQAAIPNRSRLRESAGGLNTESFLYCQVDGTEVPKHTEVKYGQLLNFSNSRIISKSMKVLIFWNFFKCT